MTAAGHVLAIIVHGDDGSIGAGGTDDDIGRHKLIVQIAPLRGPAVPLVGERLGSLEVSIENDNLLDASVGQVLERFLRHFAGAYDECPLVVEPLENPRGEIGDRHARNTDAMAVQRSLVGNSPASTNS